jgi:glycosyltransferase involved in cell wall biosynthesis
MKIAYAGTLPPHPGGSAIVGGALLAGLARRGHEIAAVAPITAETLERGDPLAGASFAVARYLVPDFERAPNHPSSADFRAREGASVVSNLAPILNAMRPDLVIAGRETFAWHIPGLARRHGAPSVVLAQGATTWGVLDGSYPRELARALLGRLGEADRVIAVAHHLARRLRAVGLERVDTIPNAVDPRTFAPTPPDPALMRRLDITPDRLVVAHISNLKDIKRPLDVVRSAALALEHDPRLLYLVVGDGPARADIEAECRRAALLDHFRFAGWVPHAEVPRYLNVADIVVMPSEVEALALVYLEAQACERLLIASDIPAAREVVEDGATGLLFPPGDVPALAEVTLRAAADPVLRSVIGARARTFAASRPFEAALSEYEAVLAAVARSTGT